jgi:hypothetical protein
LVPDWIWDPAKDRLNRLYHGIPLAYGVRALADPMVLSRPDPHADGDRWRSIGVADGIAVLFVVHTEPIAQSDGREVGRIISVRKASARERRAYEEDAF